MSQPRVCESQAHCPTNLLQLSVALDERLQRNGRNKSSADREDLFGSDRPCDVTNCHWSCELTFLTKAGSNKTQSLSSANIRSAFS